MRQIGGIWEKYEDKGATGLVSKGQGKPSNNRLPSEFMEDFNRLSLSAIMTLIACFFGGYSENKPNKTICLKSHSSTKPLSRFRKRGLLKANC